MSLNSIIGGKMVRKLALLLVFIFLSCATKSIKPEKSVPLFEILSQQSDGGASINFYEILTEPREIKMLQNDENLKKKISASDITSSNFVILNMGEKPTTGYSIGIEKIEETDQSIVIYVKEVNPEPGLMVNQIISHPYCVIKINSKKEIIIK